MVNNIPSYAYYIKNENVIRVDALLQELTLIPPEADNTSSVAARNFKTMLKFIMAGIIAYFLYKKFNT
jgi:hypothetical protein